MGAMPSVLPLYKLSLRQCKGKEMNSFIRLKIAFLFILLGRIGSIVYSNESVDCFHHPVWSPVDNSLVYSSCNGEESDLWKINLDTGEIINLSIMVTGDSRDPVWSPDGHQIAFINVVNDDPTIWIMNADGSNLYNFSARFSELAETQEASIVWSSDGSHIAFIVSEGFGLGTDIYQASLNNSELIQLTSSRDQGAYDYLNWSPDGTAISAIYLDFATYSMDIVTVELATLNQDILYELNNADQFISGLEWSDNWQEVVFILQDSRQNEIISIDLATKATTALALDILGSKSNPRFSPNSQKIVFEDFDSNGNHLWVMDIQNLTAYNLTQDMDHNLYFSPSWSPDGTRIAFDSPNGDIWIINIDGTHPINLTEDN